jgi:hypothetical protein
LQGLKMNSSSVRSLPTFNRSAVSAIALSVLLVAGGLYATRASAQAATDVGETKPTAAMGANHGAAHGAHKGHHGMSRQGHGERMMGRMDADKDGSVSKTELQASQQKQIDMFDRADTNKDGKLSVEERKAFHDAMRSEHRAKRG